MLSELAHIGKILASNPSDAALARERSVETFDGLRAVHFHQTDPGTKWRKDDRIAIDRDRPLDSERILTPNVIRLSTGGYRMYYLGCGPARTSASASAYILSAISEDGDSWEKDPGIRVDVHPPYAAKCTMCPDVIPLAHGGYRMYYEARTEARPTVVLSATSDDGLQWDLEPGVRFGDPNWSYGSPRCLYISEPALRPDYRFRLYFHRYTYNPFRSGLDAHNVIISAISKDGLCFEEEDGVRIAQETERETFAVYAPEVIRLGDGTYRMYYPPWCDEFKGGVFTATSAEGLTWTKAPDPLVDLGGPWDSNMVSEPCVIELPDGRSRMFYEAKDANGSTRILSATSY